MVTVKKKKALTGAQRTKRNADKKIEAGLVSARMWIHPDEADAVRAYANKKPLTKVILKNL